MNLVERNGSGLVFSLGAREKGYLERLLGFYPLMPDTGAVLTRDTGNEALAEPAQLLQESLRHQRAENARWLSERLSAGAAWSPEGERWRLALDGADAERLLQILNDLRVGAWTRLGCPEAGGEDDLVQLPERARFYAVMMLAGQFEMELIHGMHDELGQEPRVED